MTNVIDYAWGQCTWFVAHSLSWLGVGQVGALGNASNWYGAAQAKGLAVGSTPAVGAAVVYNSSYPGSGRAGHVGVVTGVNPNGTFQVASDNWGGLGKTHIGTSTLSDVEGFIYAPSVAAGVQGAQNALNMAGGGSVGGLGTETTASTSGVSTTPAGLNLNPLDPNSIWNIGNDLAVAGSWLERGAIILFGAIVIFIGIKVLFTGSSGVSEVIGSPASEEPQTSEHFEQQSQTPSGQSSIRSTTTKTRHVKGSGLRGLLPAASE